MANIFQKFLRLLCIFHFKVFKDQGSSCRDRAHEVAESILSFFPGFQAVNLPPPTNDSEVLRNINREKSKLNSQFLEGIEQFKRLLWSMVTPKHSFNDGEVVTGEGRTQCSIDWNFSTLSLRYKRLS